MEHVDVEAELDFRSQEHGLVRHILAYVAVAIPIFVGIWVGLVALAVSFTAAGFAPPLAMAAALGALDGAFFGTWAAFVAFTHTSEHLDRNNATDKHRTTAGQPPLPGP